MTHHIIKLLLACLSSSTCPDVFTGKTHPLKEAIQFLSKLLSLSLTNFILVSEFSGDI
ncbi:hypothetical protein ID866_11141 [Astraeus odoratus]|nr:hypothetical protein ID866_11141 [Astraeus odoratus]